MTDKNLAHPTPEVSIVILAKNEEKNIRLCLEGIAAQDTARSVEVILIDSGSTDRTRDIAAEFGVRIEQIRPEEFQHGRTRNLGAQLAKGDLLVYLVADAYPADEHWLERVIEPLSDPAVGGAYTRHLPKPGAIPPMAFAITHRYGVESLRQKVETDGSIDFDNARLSNVSSAFHRKLVLEMPFPENLIMCEDVGIAKQLLASGYEIQYVGTTAVHHSHNYSLSEVFRRYFDLGVAFTEMFSRSGNGVRNMKGKSVTYLVDEAKMFLRERRFGWLFFMPVYEGARLAGYFLGRRYRRLPATVNKKLSMYRGFWDLQQAR